MNYGIVIHSTTQNIGDDIQTYAASKLVPRVDYVIEREKINSFKSKNNEPVCVIMGAWYMWKKYNWPPSANIIPIFVGFHYTSHITNMLSGFDVDTEFLDNIGGEYLKAYEPIGCRDTHTMKLLGQKGIDVEFSGCVTLTLPKQDKNPKREKYICLVDLDADVERSIREKLNFLGYKFVPTTHLVDYRNAVTSLDEKFEKVEKLLKLYQNAEIIFTRRLHCLLPCLAMEVPVTLVSDDKLDFPRFAPYDSWVNKVDKNTIINKDYIINTDINAKNLYALKTKDKLLSTIKEFIHRAENGEAVQQFTADSQTVDKWRKSTILELIEKQLNLMDETFMDQIDNKQNKHTNYYRVLCKWLNVKESKIDFSEMIHNMGFKNIAVYGGNGLIGKHLVNELDKSNLVECRYIIDKNSNHSIKREFTLEKFIELDCKIDLIISIISISEISSEITNKYELLSLEYLLDLCLEKTKESENV